MRSSAVTDRLLSVVEAKVEGKEITSVGEQVQRTQVIDLMDALKQSLESRVKDGRTAAKKPAAKASRAAQPAKEKKRASR